MNGAASSIAGISNAIRSVGTIPSTPRGFTSSTPRPLAIHCSVQCVWSVGSILNSGVILSLFAPTINIVSASQADCSGSLSGTPVAPRTTASKRIVEPVSTGGDTVARRSVPVPSSIVLISTLPPR